MEWLSRIPWVKYKEEEGLVSCMKTINIHNIFTVRDVVLPLEKGDIVEQAMTEQEFILCQFSIE